jgi:uncharacterized membrane protein
LQAVFFVPFGKESGVNMSIAAKIKAIIKKEFVAGLLVTVPLIATYFILRFLFDALDGILNPLVQRYFGYNIPGLGAVVTILLILLAGIITTNYLGAKLYAWGDKFLVRTPFIRIVYTAAKQLIESMVAPSSKAFSEVALIEYPRKGAYAIGFLSGETRLQKGRDEQKMRLVFVPSTPTPFTGMVILLPESEIHPINISVENAVKILVSGGIVTPEVLALKGEGSLPRSTDAAG